jgi:hypothetical protein
MNGKRFNEEFKIEAVMRVTEHKLFYPKLQHKGLVCLISEFDPKRTIACYDCDRPEMTQKRRPIRQKQRTNTDQIMIFFYGFFMDEPLLARKVAK